MGLLYDLFMNVLNHLVFWVNRLSVEGQKYLWFHKKYLSFLGE